MRLYSYGMIKSPTPTFTFVSCKQTKSGWWEGMFFSYSVTMVTTLWSKQLPYSSWCKFSRKCVCTLQKKFTQFLFSLNKSMMLWPHPYQMMDTPHMHVYQRNDTEQRSEASLCNNGLLFLSQLQKYQDCWRGWKLACWTEGFSTADLELDNFGVLLTGSLVFCTHSSRLSLFCSDLLQGRHYFCSRRTVVVPIHIT